MYRFLVVLSLVVGCSSSQKFVEVNDAWLNEVKGEKSLAWVNSQNMATKQSLNIGGDSYKEKYKKALAVYSDNSKIPYPGLRGEYIYNFWQDKKNVKGVWRRTKKTSYMSGSPRWETLLDIDKLAKKEAVDWAYKGLQCSTDDFDKCMIFLSPDGGDAYQAREFSKKKKAFVNSGFFLKKAKQSIKWFDKDHLLVSSDFGAGTMSKAGYPRQLKLWKRGTQISEAQLIAEVPQDYVGIWPGITKTDSDEHVFVYKYKSMFSNERYYLEKQSKKLVRLPLPLDAQGHGIFKDTYLFNLQTSQKINGVNIKAGDLYGVSWAELTKGETKGLTKIYSPSRNESLQSASVSKNQVILNILRDVKSVLKSATSNNGQWSLENIKLPYDNVTAKLSFVHPKEEVSFISLESFVAPPGLYSYVQSDVKLMYEQKKSFDSSGLEVKQYFATSKDKTKVPYFVVAPKSQASPVKTLMYAYGGFGVSLRPRYLSAKGPLWLEGNNKAYVVANIRGGGEYGPDWHKSAILSNRQKAYDDFFAITKDLVAKGITTPSQLAIEGGSNGGLLMGVAMTQRPDLFGAIVCAVPLLDMLGFHKLLAGASWMGEYGNPDNKKDYRYLKKYSPYHNIKKNQVYPKTLFMSTTSDDRVHPGHARRMAYKLSELGYKNHLLYEDTQGGHSMASDVSGRAKKTAIKFEFIEKALVN